VDWIDSQDVWANHDLATVLFLYASLDPFYQCGLVGHW
jgi:hypothetical protein